MAPAIALAANHTNPEDMMTDTIHSPTAGWRLEYTITGLHGDTITAAGKLDGNTIWSFKFIDLSAEYDHPMLDVVVPHYSFLAFADARSVFTDLAVDGPDTLDGARKILECNGFVQVDAESAG